MKVLSIAHSMLRHDSPHGGGQTYAYYMHQIAKNPSMQLYAICMCNPNESNKEDFKNFNASGELLFTKGGLRRNIRRIFWDIYGKVFHKTSIDSYYKHREYIRAVKRLQKKGYYPDVIILEWTQCVSIAQEIKTIYPYSKLIASEHDVMFLSFERQAKQFDRDSFQYLKAIKKANSIRKEELTSLMLCDVVMPHNHKDEDLLIKNGIPTEKIHPITAYFHDYKTVNRDHIENDILFWGAMSRPENYNAAIWFIKNVMPMLHNTDVRFIVVGNKPHESLLQLASEKVIITGFVEDPIPYFEKALCLCAPLLVGAGIKIKILEALSAGIPVLTNDIGIEGIPAVDGESYFYCKCAEDYCSIIKKLLLKELDQKLISESAQKIINNNFNMLESGLDYINIIGHK